MKFVFDQLELIIWVILALIFRLKRLRKYDSHRKVKS